MSEPLLTMELTSRPNFAAFASLLKARQQAFFELAMQLVVEDVVEGINAHRSIGGGALPPLEESTIKRKGHNMQLIDRGLLGDIETYETVNNYRAGNGTITIKARSAPRQILRQKSGGGWTTRGKRGPSRTKVSEGASGYTIAAAAAADRAAYAQHRRSNYDTPRDAVAYYLQVEGTKTGKHFEFFGISQDVSARITDLIEVIIADSLAATQ